MADQELTEKEQWRWECYLHNVVEEKWRVRKASYIFYVTDRNEAENLTAYLTQTQQALDRAVEALKFYADKENYIGEYGGCSSMDIDRGDEAKATLASIKE